MVENRTSYGNKPLVAEALVTPENAAALDKEASALWGLSPFALVEAAGRSCAAELLNKLKNSMTYARYIEGPILVCAGSGNNGADALVMLRALINSQQLTIGISGTGTPYNAAVLLSRFPSADETTPRSAAVKALQAMGVPVVTWNGNEHTAELFHNARLIIDGIAGTGLKSALEGIPLEMLRAINERRNAAQCCVVSIDVPSGACSNRKPDFPVIHADFTLAVEPLKTVLYTPALRPYCGQIIPVRGIFPVRLLEKYIDAELLHWETQCNVISPVSPDAYKYSRGVVTIHAGSHGTLGAARIAAAGASASGAGMVRLILDDEVYPVLASGFGGIMAVPASNIQGNKNDKNSFVPDCLLLGPGWGRGKERLSVLQQALKAEETGTPLILDADGIYLLKTLCHEITAEKQNNTVFHGRAILTPHAGELEAFSGMPKEQLLSDPLLIAEQAKKLNAVILFKSHVMIIASPDGRLGFIDGMNPSLGAGGSGDLLAGLCAGIAGRIRAGEKPGKDSFDPYLVSAAAGTLLVIAARQMGQRFYDPLDLAEPAAVLAGRAWLPEKSGFSLGPDNER